MSQPLPTHCPRCQTPLSVSPVRCHVCGTWTADAQVPPALALAIGVDFLQLELASIRQSLKPEDGPQALLTQLEARLAHHQSTVQGLLTPAPAHEPAPEPTHEPSIQTEAAPAVALKSSTEAEPLATAQPLTGAVPVVETPTAVDRPPSRLEPSGGLLFSLEAPGVPDASAATAPEADVLVRPPPLQSRSRLKPAGAVPPVPRSTTVASHARPLEPAAPMASSRLEVASPRFVLPERPEGTPAPEVNWRQLRPLVAENLLWFVGAFMTLVGAFYFASTHWTGLSPVMQSFAILSLILGGAGGLGALASFLSRQPGLRLAGRVLAAIGVGLLPATAIPLRILLDLSWLSLGLGVSVVGAFGTVYLPRVGPMVSRREGASLLVTYLPLCLLPVLLPVLQNVQAESLLLWLPLPFMARALWQHNTSEGRDRLERGFALGIHLYAGGVVLLWAANATPPSLWTPVLAGLSLGALYFDLALSHWRGVTRLYLARLPALLGLAGLLLSLVAAVVDRAIGTPTPGPVLTLLVGTAGLTLLSLLWRERTLFPLALASSLVTWIALPDLSRALAGQVLALSRSGLGYTDSPLPWAWYIFTVAPYLGLMGWVTGRLKAIDYHREAGDVRRWITLVCVGLSILPLLEALDLRPALFGLPLLVVVLYRLHRDASERLPVWVAQGLLVCWLCKLMDTVQAPVPAQGMVLALAGALFFEGGTRLARRLPPRPLGEVWCQSGILLVVLTALAQLGALAQAPVWWSAAGLFTTGLAALFISLRTLSPWGVLVSIPLLGLGGDQIRMGLGIVSNPLVLPWIALGVLLLAWFWPLRRVQGQRVDWLQRVPLEPFRPSLPQLLARLDAQLPKMQTARDGLGDESAAEKTPESPPATGLPEPSQHPVEGLVSGPLWLWGRIALLGALVVVFMTRLPPLMGSASGEMLPVSLMVPSVPLLAGLGLMIHERLLQAETDSPDQTVRALTMVLLLELFLLACLPTWLLPRMPETTGSALLSAGLVLAVWQARERIAASRFVKTVIPTLLWFALLIPMLTLPELLGEGPRHFYAWLYGLVGLTSLALGILLNNRLGISICLLLLYTCVGYLGQPLVRALLSDLSLHPLEPFVARLLMPGLLMAVGTVLLRQPALKVRSESWSDRLQTQARLLVPARHALTAPQSLLEKQVWQPLRWVGMIGGILGLSLSLLLPDDQPWVVSFALSALTVGLLLRGSRRILLVSLLPAMMARAVHLPAVWSLSLVSLGAVGLELWGSLKRSAQPRTRGLLMAQAMLPLMLAWDMLDFMARVPARGPLASLTTPLYLVGFAALSLIGFRHLLQPPTPEAQLEPAANAVTDASTDALTDALTDASTNLSTAQNREPLASPPSPALVWMSVESLQLTAIAAFFYLSGGLNLLEPLRSLPGLVLLTGLFDAGLELTRRGFRTAPLQLRLEPLQFPQAALVLFLGVVLTLFGGGLSLLPQACGVLGLALVTLTALARGIRGQDAAEIRLSLVSLLILGAFLRLQTGLGTFIRGYEALGLMGATLPGLLILDWSRQAGEPSQAGASGLPTAGLRRAVLRAPLRELVIGLPLLSLGLAAGLSGASQLTVPLVVLAGAAYLGLHVVERSPSSLVMGAIALNVALLAQLVKLDASNLVLYSALPGLTLIGLAHHYRTRLSSTTLNVLRYGGLSLLYSASYIEAWGQPLNNLILVLLCLGGMGWGLHTRVKSFLYLGAGVLVTTLLTTLLRVGLAHPEFNALYLILLGVSILAGMVVFTWKRQQLVQLSSDLQGKLEGWE